MYCDITLYLATTIDLQSSVEVDIVFQQKTLECYGSPKLCIFQGAQKDDMNVIGPMTRALV